MKKEKEDVRKDRRNMENKKIIKTSECRIIRQKILGFWNNETNNEISCIGKRKVTYKGNMLTKSMWNKGTMIIWNREIIRKHNEIICQGVFKKT